MFIKLKMRTSIKKKNSTIKTQVAAKTEVKKIIILEKNFMENN